MDADDRPPPLLLTAIRWHNGMVLCLDEAGEQIERLQGEYDEVKAAVLEAAHASTQFCHGVWSGELTQVKREEW
jgi:hypothetical protein